MNMFKSHATRPGCGKVASILFLIAGLLLNLWYQIVPGENLVNSDMAAEMMLADILNRDKALISDHWYYASWIKIFDLQWFYRIGLLLSPDNWHIARVIGESLLFALFLYALWRFVRLFEIKEYAIWICGLCMLPVGRLWFVFTLWGGYYMVYVIFTLLILTSLIGTAGALQSGSIKELKVRSWLSLLIGLLVSFISGLNGFRMVMVLIAPLCLTVVVHLILSIGITKPTEWKAVLTTSKTQITMLILSAVAAFANLCGVLVNNLVLTKMVHFVDAEIMADIEWCESAALANDVLWSIREFFLLFGFQGKTRLFSFEGIASGIGLLIGILIFLMLVALGRMYRKLSDTEQFLYLLTLCSLFVNVLLFCFFRFDAGGVQYFTFFIPYVMVLIGIFLRHAPITLPNGKTMLTVTLSVLFVITSAATVKYELGHPYFAQKH